jgi:hypothetical protein
LGDIPSNNEANLDNFQVPTDADLPARKTTVASKEKSCECCGKGAAKVASMGKKVHAVKCDDCKTAMTVCGQCIEKDASCPNCKTAQKKEDDSEVNDTREAINSELVEKDNNEAAQNTVELNNSVENANENLMKGINSNVSNARIKAAYSCATKLALAGIINSDECDSYADQLLEDGLRADVMIKNTQLLLRSAQASAERVASAAAQKLNTRTASAMSISTSPALSGSSNSAALDIQSALKGTWTMPKIED